MNASTNTFAFARIRGHGRDWQPLREAVVAALPEERIWGTFHGLFGIASNELVAVTVGGDEAVAASIDTLSELDAVDSVASLTLVPTVRPKDARPLTREGLYVFRFFEVAHRDVEEIAALSAEAWKTFENVDAYRAEPQGLFCQRDRSAERGRMLLLTWYDGLNSWQASRQSPPPARENFGKRHALTTGTIAYATRLVVGGSR